MANIPGYDFAPDSRLIGWNDPRLVRANGENDLTFAARLTTNVHRATYHCEMGQDWGSYGLLAIEGFVCGYCHQRAYILAKALLNGGLSSATMLGLNGHVVTVFTHDNQLYAADPDYGVLPFALPPDPAAIATKVRAVYGPVGQLHGSALLNLIVDAYSTTSNNSYYNMQTLQSISASQAATLGY